MADRMATRIQLDPVRTNLAHREGAEAAHMPASLSILAQSLPWREFVFAEGDRVATLIATLGVKLCFFGKPGFLRGYQGTRRKSLRTHKVLGTLVMVRDDDDSDGHADDDKDSDDDKGSGNDGVGNAIDGGGGNNSVGDDDGGSDGRNANSDNDDCDDGDDGGGGVIIMMMATLNEISTVCQAFAFNQPIAVLPTWMMG